MASIRKVVIATAGDTLGGEDFDNRVIDHFVKLYKKKTGTDVVSNLRTMGKLKREVEKAKRTLSSQQSVRLEIEAFENGNDFRRPSPTPNSRKSTWISSGKL